MSKSDDLIRRAAAQTELMMKCERYTLARESHGMGHVEWSDELIDLSDAMDAIRDLPSAQPETHEERTETHACDCIERQAVEHLDRFTKIYCRDKSITDDLAFRCGKCEFEMPDKTCLVKVMARKLCPDYKDFGAMGDL